MTLYRFSIVESESSTILFLNVTDDFAIVSNDFDKELDKSYILETKSAFPDTKYVISRVDRKEITSDWETVKQKITFI